MNLITTSVADKQCYACPVEKNGTEFSYSLNCREIYLKTNARGSWHDSQFARSVTGPSKIIIVEESNYIPFPPESPDKDNYSQNCISFTTGSNYYPLNHNDCIPILYVDGHSSSIRFFDTALGRRFNRTSKG